jgi:hypothetical protein
VSNAPVAEPSEEQVEVRSFRFLQTLAPEQDPSASAHAFGRSLAVSPALSVVGSPSEFATPGASVSAFSLRDGRWEPAFELSSPHGGSSGFGAAVATDGDLIVVGAPLADLDGSEGPTLDNPPNYNVVSRAGAVYVFERGEQGFALSEILHAPISQAWQNFGGALALDHGRLVVGASDRDREGVVDAGAAFVFERIDGHFAFYSELGAPEPQAGDRFGATLALLGDTLVVGAPLRDRDGVSDAGAAYVFARQDARFAFREVLLGEPSERALFGASMALSYITGLRQRLLVGAPGRAVDALPRAGLVHVFETPGTTRFVELAGLTSNAPSEEAGFGSTLGQERGWAVVGSNGDCASHPPEIFASSFEGLTHHSLLSPPEGMPGTSVSASVALADGHLLWGTLDTPGAEEEAAALASTVHAFEIAEP